MISKIISWSFWRSTIWSIRQSCKTFGSVQLIQLGLEGAMQLRPAFSSGHHSVSGGGKRFNRAPLSTESQMLTSPQQRFFTKGKWHELIRNHTEHQKPHCFKENEAGQGVKKKSWSLTSTEPITITISVIVDSLLQSSKNPLPGMGHHYTIDTNSQQDFTTASTVAQSTWHHHHSTHTINTNKWYNHLTSPISHLDRSHGWDVHPCSILYHIYPYFIGAAEKRQHIAQRKHHMEVGTRSPGVAELMTESYLFDPLLCDLQLCNWQPENSCT